VCSSIAGLCTGVATRRLGRTVAVGVGFTFVALQGLQYLGVIENVRCVAVCCCVHVLPARVVFVPVAGCMHIRVVHALRCLGFRWDRVNDAVVRTLDSDKDGKITTEV
jgi:hypothetical protein